MCIKLINESIHITQREDEPCSNLTQFESMEATKHKFSCTIKSYIVLIIILVTVFKRAMPSYHHYGAGAPVQMHHR